LILVVALLEGFLAGVFAGALLVWFYNRFLYNLRESWIKKSLALATLPLAFLSGCGHAVAVVMEWPHLLLPVWGGVIVMALRSVGWLRARRNNRSTRRRSALLPGLGLNRPYYSRPVQLVLRAIAPINQVDAVELVTREIPVAGLHKDLDGFRILFLTDFHVHPTLTQGYFRAIVRYALSRRADVLLIGGDFVSRRWHIPLARQLLKPLWSHPEVYAVRGNHDFWTRPSLMARSLQRHGARLLSNDFAVIQRGEGRLVLVGLEDPYIPLTPRERDRLMAAMPADVPRLGLVHTPEAYHHAAALGCVLAFAGHTHGGQVRLPFFGTTVASVSMREEYLHGIGYMGDMTTWTSNGLGAFYPLRVDCPPQVVEATLRAV
jgi:uncharacterized protein